MRVQLPDIVVREWRLNPELSPEETRHDDDGATVWTHRLWYGFEKSNLAYVQGARFDRNQGLYGLILDLIFAVGKYEFIFPWQFYFKQNTIDFLKLNQIHRPSANPTELTGQFRGKPIDAYVSIDADAKYVVNTIGVTPATQRIVREMIRLSRGSYNG
jgi:hypothetical protein